MTQPSRLYLAVDPGAGNLKICGKPFSHVMIRSILKFGTQKDFLFEYVSVAPDVLHYVSGSNSNLVDKYWIAGDSVTDRKLKVDTPYEDINLKTVNALPLLLAALIREVKISPGQTNVVMICSSHDPGALGVGLVKEFVGWHEIICNGSNYQIQIQMPQPAVVAEGSSINYGDAFSTFDLGYLTCILTPRTRDGIPLIEQVHRSDYGVGNLIDRISNHSDLRAMLGGLPGNPAFVSNGLIEATTENSSTILYRGSGKCLNITKIYTECLKEWVRLTIAPALTILKERKGTAYKIIAIGGGVKLPKMETFLTNRGMSIYQGDPVMANAESLFNNRLLPVISKTLAGDEDNFKFESFESVAKGATHAA